MLVLIAGWMVARAQDCETGAYGCGHAEMHPQYQGWNMPGQACCSNADCRPVRAYKDENGDWRMFLPERRGMTKAPELIDGWLRVPSAKVDVQDKFHDGRSHGCTSKPWPVGTQEYDMSPVPTVYCFSPAVPKG